jgi:Na+:H+ antiporter, NhaA family
MADETTGRRRRMWGAAVPRLSLFAVEHLLLLPLGAVIALVWANTGPESYFRFSYTAAFVVNDVAMVFFFGLMTKEVVQATAPGGVLHPWRRALLPVIASIGVTLVPTLIHTYLVAPLDEPMLASAWPVTFATDVAVAYFTARLVFGKHHSAIPFVILLAISCDAIGFVVIGIYNPTHDRHLAVGLLILAAAMSVASGLRRARVKSFWPYVLGPGAISWFAHYWSGLHPALALVPIIPFLPHAARDPGFFVDASPGSRDTLSRFELYFRYPAQMALFFFGLVNAGVQFGALEEGTWALPVAVLVGKPVGILFGAGLAVVAGLHLPQRIGWRDLVTIGFMAAVGFSVGLFFSTALLPPGQLRSEINMGVMLSLVGLPLALMVSWALGVGRFAPKPAP